jgi:two-component system cell cycle sensor histidine kinase/response regulator CckA
MLDMKPTVLVVEDEVGVRNLISTILRLSGFDVLACSDGDEALDMVKLHGTYVHLVITDLNLGPSLGGRELAGSLRHLFPSLPLLYISGSEEDSLVNSEVDGGLAFFLLKPFTPKGLTDKVFGILSDKFKFARLHHA